MAAGCFRAGSGCLLAAFLAGCQVYTGFVRNEFVEQERMDERVLRDELAIEVPAEPRPSAPTLELKILWNFEQEYKIRKYYRVYREYLAYDPWMEVLEILSSPFLFLTVLPTSVVLAPIELACTALGGDLAAAAAAPDPEGGDAGGSTIRSGSRTILDDFLFLRMAALPFEFLNPAGNADRWVAGGNVYGKVPQYEREGSLTDRVEIPPNEQWTRDAAGAQVIVRIVETAAKFSITAQAAEVSQAGKGLTLRIEASYEGKKAAREVSISPETLETIYEALKSD
jgi:hypothetical protein